MQGNCTHKTSVSDVFFREPGAEAPGDLSGRCSATPRRIRDLELEVLRMLRTSTNHRGAGASYKERSLCSGTLQYALLQCDAQARRRGMAP